ncbi:MAG: diadenylate cyclase CdaA [Alistipes sp.]|nr:diadenylate cyclase CdaA [Alistipes sp.]
MGFINIGFIDIIDIVAVATLMYYLYKMARGTNAPSIITGIILIYILWVITQALNMELLSSILGNVIGVGVIALIVVFQPEIRQFLQSIGLRQRNSGRGTSSLWKKLFGSGRSARIDVSPIVRAALDMSADKTGALIVIRQETDLAFIAETGIALDAQTSVALIENIFFKNAPLHDGAVIIHDNRVVAAKCVLPTTRARVPKNYGMRHRAALGISEITDAVVVVVSEETGGISIAHEGAIERSIARENFETKLLAALGKVDN